MNKLSKTIFFWLGLFIMSSLIGSIIFLSSTGFIEYNRGNLEKIEINEIERVMINGLNNVEIISLSTDIEIIETNFSEFVFELTGEYINNSYNDLPRLNVVETEGEVSVEIIYPKQRLVLGLGQNRLKLKVFVPKNYLKGLNVKTASGDLKIKDLDLSEFKLITISGDIGVEDIVSNKFEIGTTSGDISVRNFDGETFEIRTVSGNIKLINSSINFVKTASGDVSIRDLLVKEDLEIKTISGNVNICYLDGLFDVEFESVSGNFNGEESFEEGLKGESSFFIKTVSGDLKVGVC